MPPDEPEGPLQKHSQMIPGTTALHLPSSFIRPPGKADFNGLKAPYLGWGKSTLILEFSQFLIALLKADSRLKPKANTISVRTLEISFASLDRIRPTAA